jgi:hypothetical protein
LLHLTCKFLNSGTSGALTTELALSISFGQNRRVVSRVIPFYIPKGFKPRVKVKIAPASAAARVIEFRSAEAKKPA